MIQKRTQKQFEYLLFVGPLLLLYTVFFLYPLVQSFYYSFTDWNGLRKEIQMVGFKNYGKAFDSRFIGNIRFTLLYTVFCALLVNLLALGMALMLNRGIKSGDVVKTILFSPYVLNVATIGFVWQFIYGRLMNGLYDATQMAIFDISWLADKNYVMWAIIIVKIWQSMGYFMVIYLAGLRSIPAQLIDAATVDGAVGLKRFFHVTMPLLMTSFTVCVFLALINGLRVFGLLITMTYGGPGYASESIALNIYRTGFQRGDFGLASAKSVIFLFMILIITFIQLRFFKKREVEY